MELKQEEGPWNRPVYLASLYEHKGQHEDEPDWRLRLTPDGVFTGLKGDDNGLFEDHDAAKDQRVKWVHDLITDQ